MRKRIFKLIFLCVFITLLIQASERIYDRGLGFIYKKDYSEYVEKYAQEYNVEENLVYAIIKNESNFNSNAVSAVGAVGLMQLMESTADDIAKELDRKNFDLYSPEDNINFGVKYFSKMLQKYGQPSLALAAYNAGFGNVDSWLDNGILKRDGTDYYNIPFKETNMYVRKILRDYEVYVTRNS